MSLIAIAAVLALSGPAAPSAPPFSQQAWIEDYAALKSGLERGYSHLAWVASPEGGVDLPALDRRTLERLRAAQSDADARRALQDFVAGLRDGHLGIQEAAPAQPAPPLPEPPAAELAGVDADTGCAALGYASNRSPANFSMPFETLPGFRLIADGERTAFRAGLITSQGRIVGLIRIKNFSQSQYRAACVAAWRAPGAPAPASFEFTNAVTDAWLAEMAALLRQLREAGADTLIVDVGSNSGGNDSGDWASRLFTPRDVRSAPLLMSAAELATVYLNQQMGFAEAGAKRAKTPAVAQTVEQARRFYDAKRAEVDGRKCDMTWVWRERRRFEPYGACSRLIDVGFAGGPQAFLPPTPAEDRRNAVSAYSAATADPWRGAWDRPVHVLTNGTTYSSAEMFTAVMRDNDVARTFGARTGGDGCGFMAHGAPLVLPNSRLRVRMPNCVRLRRDGGDEVAGIAPDFPVEPTPGESPRAMAARALATVLAAPPLVPQNR